MKRHLYCSSLFPGFDTARSLLLHSGVAARGFARILPGSVLAGVRVEILDLRHFSSADLRPLLDDEIQVWADLLCWDYTGSAEMILRYMDAKFLPGYAAVSRGKVFGYSFFVYENNKGVIGDMFVREGENGMNRVEVERRLLSHDAGAASKPLEDEGFSRPARLFMILPLGTTANGNDKLSAQFEIRRW